MKLQLESLDVVLNYKGRLRCDPGWRLDAQWARDLRDYDLWYIWAGRGRMITSTGEIDLYPGRGLWMRPGRRYEAEQDKRERLGVSFVHFRLRSKRRLLALSEFTPPVEVFETRFPDYFNNALVHVTRLPGRDEFPAQAALLVKALLLEAAEASPRDESAPGLERHHREAIAHALDFLRENPSASVGELARRSSYSLDHFTRVFLQVTGETPKDYAVRLRLERAMTLLHDSSQTISQIADVVGYRDVGFFSRQFKQKVGVSPAGFRRGRRAA